MTDICIETLPSKVMMIIWLKQLIKSKRARISKNRKKIIELSSGASSIFCIGKSTETARPIITVHHSMLPWFISIDLYHCVIDSDNYIYLGFGLNNADFYIRIKSYKERVNLLRSKEEINHDIVRTIDIHGLYMDGDTPLISRPLQRCPIIDTPDVDMVIPEEADDIDTLWIDSLEFSDIDLEDPKYWGKLKDGYE